MKVPVNGHSLPLLPALDRPDIPVQVGRDLLPGFEAGLQNLLCHRHPARGTLPHRNRVNEWMNGCHGILPGPI